MLLELVPVLQAAPIFFFFFNDTATTEIYTLSLHDALPISAPASPPRTVPTSSTASTGRLRRGRCRARGSGSRSCARSEEHTSELQSPCNLVCRLLLEKKKSTHTTSSSQHRIPCTRSPGRTA